MADTNLKDVYLFWTNKGGVGKTTLCFHTAITWAKAHPNQNVVVVDLDEQANLSQTILTELRHADPGDELSPKKTPELSKKRKSDALDDGVALQAPKGFSYTPGGDKLRTLQNIDVTDGYYISRTIMGYNEADRDRTFDSCAYSPPPADANSTSTTQKGVLAFLVNPHLERLNVNMPANLYLLPGDPRTMCLVPKIQAFLSAPGAQDAAPGKACTYQIELESIKRFTKNVAKELPAPEGTVVFIDCNPSLNIWTQMGLLASTKLILPVNADDFSSQALTNILYSVYGMFPIGGQSAKMEKHMFHNVVKDLGMSMPKVHAIIHNKSRVFTDSTDSMGKLRKVSAFEALGDKQAMLLFNAFELARQGMAGTLPNDHARIFNLDQLPTDDQDEKILPQNAESFAQAFTGTMRDMFSCGVATLHGGFPLWCTKRLVKGIKDSLNCKSVSHGAESSFMDLIGAEKTLPGRNGTVEGPASSGPHRTLLNLVKGSSVPEAAVAHLWREFRVNSSEVRRA